MLSRFLAVLSLSTLLLIPLVSAQTTDASVSGTVTDPSGAGRSFRLANNIGGAQKVGNGVVYFGDLKQVVDPYVAQITSLQGISL
jgi:hypothetical protein